MSKPFPPSLTPLLSPAAALADWLQHTPAGQYVRDWEQTRVDAAVADVFGFHAVQIGLPQWDLLAANRIGHQLRVDTELPPADSPHRLTLLAAGEELPLASGSVDLVILPHALELSADPHQLLREVERVLIAEGQVVITGFNPFSLWGIARRLRGSAAGAPWQGRFLNVLRLRDWLALLGFEVDRGNFGCYAPPLRHSHWLHRCRWMELAGDRWWGFAGGVYMIRAVKRVRGMRLVQPGWRDGLAARRKAIVALTPRAPHGNHRTHQQTTNKT